VYFRCPDPTTVDDTVFDFDTCVAAEVVEDYETPYDFNSIMHYSVFA
jgi:hypothetical protein